METYQAPTGQHYRDWEAVFDDAQPLPWTAFNTGYITGALLNNAQPDSFPPHRNPADRYEYAVMAFHFRHPTNGDILIDAGFDRTFHDNPPYGNFSFVMRAYSALKRVKYTQRPSDIDLMSQLQKHEIAPAHVFLTHLHADHTGGLPALPSQSHVYYGKQERTFLSHLINTAPTPVLIVGDAELTTWAMQDEILVSAVDGARGKQEVQRSANMIRTFHAAYPHVQIWFSHDEDHL